MFRFLVANTIEHCSGKADLPHWHQAVVVIVHVPEDIAAALWLPEGAADVGFPEGCPESHPCHFDSFLRRA